MEWNIVKIEPSSGNNVPFVSIGRGRLDFNASACNLVDDEKKHYRYAQLLTTKERGKTIVGIKFLVNNEPNTIEIKRKMQKGKEIKGMIVVNKGIVSALFGKNGTNDGMIRFSVELVDGTNNILKIID